MNSFFRNAILAAVSLSLIAALEAQAAGEPAASPDAAASSGRIKYRSGKDVNFEELLIQGQLKRPEIMVVTGNTHQGTDGLLRLRENFLDKTTAEIGEEIQ